MIYNVFVGNGLDRSENKGLKYGGTVKTVPYEFAQGYYVP